MLMTYYKEYKAEIVFSNVMLKNAPPKNKIKTEPVDEDEARQSQDVVPPDLEPMADTDRPAQVPPSVDAVIDDVIRRYSTDPATNNGDSPYHPPTNGGK